jgi:hypothetical protein
MSRKKEKQRALAHINPHKNVVQSTALNIIKRKGTSSNGLFLFSTVIHLAP